MKLRRDALKGAGIAGLAFVSVATLTAIFPFSLSPAGVVGAVYFISSLGLAYRIAKVSGPFDPLAWYMAATGLLFGLGVSVHVVNFYFFGENAYTPAVSSAKVVLINYLSVAVVCLVSAMVRADGRAVVSKSSYVDSALFIIKKAKRILFIMGFALLGMQFLLLVFPTLTSPAVGSLAQLGILAVAFVIGFAWGDANYVMRTMSVVFVAVSLVLGVLTLYKINAISQLVMFAAGYILRNQVLSPRAIIVMLFVGAFYSTLVLPVVSSARESAYYSLGEMSFQDRVAALSSSAGVGATGATGGAAANFEGTLNRFSPIVFQEFLINRYDSGMPGDSMSEWYLGFVPRMFYPDKPDITRFGREFNDLFFGRHGEASSLALTYTAEAYWNGGWVVLILVSMIYGLEIGIFRRVVSYAWCRGQFVLMLATPLAAFHAYSIESTFVAHKVGGFVSIVVVFAGARMLANRFELNRRP